MGNMLKRIPTKLRRFIEAQKVFFVATAVPDGRVNVSPKGADALRVKGPNSVRWLNLSGSGNETAGHILACNRITMMFCAFEGEPLILRLYGSARMIQPGDDDWQAVRADFPDYAGSRQVFDVTVESVQISCGMGVPFMPYQADRAEQELIPYFDELGEKKVQKYWAKTNAKTIDGFDTGILDD